ncbi:MAG: hypothetical protein RMI79_06330 [Nitrososphaerota archaeon]|nr:hypothetical protein [Nitrososphaerota archaeon]
MNQSLLDALRLLGDAAKVMIIATTLLLISFSMVLVIPSTAVSAFLRYREAESIVRGYAVLAIILALSSLILIFTSIYGIFMNSMNYFANYKNELSIVKSYIQWGFIGGLLLAILGTIFYVLGFIASPPATAAGLPLFIIGILMLWLGGIGLSVLCLKLYEEFKSILMLIAGVFFLIMGASSLISWVLVHIETKSLIAKFAGPSATTVIVPPPPP